jgi:hypothetical protein
MSWWERAKVGDKIVCMDDGLRFEAWCAEPLYAGRVYTVRQIFIAPLGEVAVLVEEIITSAVYIADSQQEVGFIADRFKPVRDTSLQVEKLKRLCLPIELVSEGAR